MKTKSAYRIKELALAGPLGRTSLYQAIKEEKLTAQKVGRCTIITHENWQSFLRSRPVLVPRHKPELS